MNETQGSPTTNPRISAGMDIPYFREGEDDPQISSAEAMNRLVGAANCIVKAKAQYGSRPAVLVSERGMVIQFPRPTATTAPVASTALHPFKIYHPDGAAANTFRVHGGYVMVPEFFPASTTPRLIDLDFAHVLRAADGTDGVTDNSDSTGSGANDIILSNWNTGTGSVYQFCGIWLTIYQSLGTAGTIQIIVEHGFNTLRPYLTSWEFPGLHAIKTTVPIGIITATGFGTIPEDITAPIDLASSTISQMLHSAVTGTYSAGPARYNYTYIDQQFYFPGDIVLWATDGHIYVQSQPDGYASIGYSPINSPEVVWTPLT